MNGPPLSPFWSNIWGIVVPAAVMLVSFLLTVFIYIKFARGGSDAKDEQLQTKDQ